MIYWDFIKIWAMAMVLIFLVMLVLTIEYKRLIIDYKKRLKMIRRLIERLEEEEKKEED